MGKHGFRFSDMLPNAWFYKLKDMSKTRTQQQHYKKKQPATKPTTQQQQQQQQQQQPHISLPKYSYNFTTQPIKHDNKYYNSPVNPKASDVHFPDPSRRSSNKKSSKRRTIYKPSPIHFSSSIQSPDYFISSTDHSSVDIDFPNYHSEDEKFVADDSCNCEVTSSTTDIIFDLDRDGCFCSRKADQKLSGFDTITELELPPILTKPTKCHEKTTKATKFRTSSAPQRSLSVKVAKEETTRRTSPVTRKSSLSRSPGIRLRANSPTIASKKLKAYSRKSISSSTCTKSQNKSISESFVVVKSSYDPQRDFRESMVEMIVENNLRSSKDLEDLLACYLSLNSNEYHALIVKAFEQVWVHMANLRLSKPLLDH